MSDKKRGLDKDESETLIAVEGEISDDTDWLDTSNYKPNVGFRQNFTDCSNVFKGFISASFVGLPFGVLQSGVGFALIFLILIAIATNHCCTMIVKCKQYIIFKKLKKLQRNGASESELEEKGLMFGKTISFGRMGKICFGEIGLLAVNISVMITQLGFTIGYFIYMGNTVRTVIKFYLVQTAPINNITHVNVLTNAASTNAAAIATINTTFMKTLHATNTAGPFSSKNLLENSSLTFAIFLVILAPILIFIAFVRDIRKLGTVSIIANVSIIVAFTATISYIISKMNGFPTSIIWFKATTFPIYFGQVTAAFEGIGTVIPIETSMAENRHRYPLFLHISIVLLSLIFGSFAIIGYLAYGSLTCQILTSNLTGNIAIVLQCLIFIGVLFTYPLQIYPCIQITEDVVIKYRKWKLTRKCEQMKTDIDTLDDFHENSVSYNILPHETNVKLKTWEGNIIRIVLVSLTALVALVFRFQFAYISAFTGSIGSSLLSYILPPLFQMSLQWKEMKTWQKIKNILLIMFGVVGGVMGITVTIINLVKSFQDGPQAHC